MTKGQSLRWMLAGLVLALLPAETHVRTQEPTPPRRGGPEIGEPHDIAFRRLQALHDMYAGADDKAEYDRRLQQESTGGGNPSRSTSVESTRMADYGNCASAAAR